jgi:TorA maturation chaperone TorD
MNAALPEMEELAPVRSAVYRFLFSALGRPTAEQHAWMDGEEFRRGLEGLCESFSVPCPDGELVPDDPAEHESRYLACFEVGFPEPPVVLLASHYNRREPAPRIIHEHILLYRRFGAQVPANSLEPADHLLHQLGFLLHLDELIQRGASGVESILHARHDLLARHLLPWIGRAADLAEERCLPPVYCALLRVIAVAVRQDHELASSALANFSPARA